jgi:hypothetical protein
MEDDQIIPALHVIGSEQGKQPVDAIIEIAKAIQPIWARISTRPGGEQQLRKFIAQALSWTPEQGEPDESLNPEVLPN